jgi:pilus assembly protein Flp/PilA
MKTIFGKIWRFLQLESGPTAVEYAVILALILLVCITAVIMFGEQTNTSFTKSSDNIRASFGGGP